MCGAAYNTTSFPSANGVLVSFDYAAWGYVGAWPRGADGTSVFLFDASQPFSLGVLGGGLGYSGCDDQGVPGLNGGYVGIGLDEYGNYGSSIYCGRGNGAGLNEMPNWVGVRGPTASNAPWLGGAPAPAGKTLEATRANKITVTVAVADNKAYTWLQYADGSRQVVLNGVPLGVAPQDLKVGFAASTGGSNNNHEVRAVKVALPVDLTANATQQPSPGGRDRIVNWDVAVSNSNLNPTDDAPVTLRGTGLTDIAWTCSNGTGGTCDAASGTSLSAGTVDLAAGGDVTYHVSGEGHGQRRCRATSASRPRPVPPTVSSTRPTTLARTAVVLTPKATISSLAHSSNGVVTTTDPTWLGRLAHHVAPLAALRLGRHERADIAGATDSTYAVGPQDAGKTLLAPSSTATERRPARQLLAATLGHASRTTIGVTARRSGRR